MNRYFKFNLTIITLVLSLLLTMITLASQAAPAGGSWYVAPSGADSNDCLSPTSPCATSNGALNKPGTILVQTGTYTGSGDEVVLLDKNVTLSGGWDTTFTMQSGVSTVGGEGERRGMTVNNGITTNVESFAVQNGYIIGSVGGIYNNGGNMTLNNSTVNGNTGDGGGIYNNDGVMALNDSTISNNTNPNGGGGGIVNIGTMTLNNTIVNGNVADDGGIGGGSINSGTMILNNIADGQAGGIYIYNGNLTLNNSSVISNATGVGHWEGGGIHVASGYATLNNNTVSGNMATNSGGGIYMSGVTLILNSSTVSNNMANRGGGIEAEFGAVTLQNTILAGNTTTGPELSPDCYANIGTAGYNLIGDTSGCTFAPNIGDRTNVNAKLGPLEGSPAYHPLLFGPAVNAGNPAGCTDHLGNLLDTDQRGMPRVGRCDIGAYEFDGPITQVFLPFITHPCPILFQDDFSNPASGWPILDTGNVLYEYRNGEYRILLRNADWWGAVMGDPSVATYIVAVDVRNVTGTYGSYGLIFGLGNDFSQFFTFEIDPEGYYIIRRYDTGNWTTLHVGHSGSINPGTAINRLKVERNGYDIAVYANEQLLATVSDNLFPDLRQLGVVVLSYNQPGVDARFDNFTIYPPDYPPACGTPSALAAVRETGVVSHSLEGALSSSWVSQPNQTGR